MKILTDEQIEQVRKEYASGKTDIELANKYLVHYRTIQNYCKGIKRKKVAEC